MALNFPGPYEVELFYTVDGITHTARYNCDTVGTPTPGDLPSTIDLAIRGGGMVQLDTAIAAWVLIWKATFDIPSSFDSFNLWKYDPGTFDRTFISAGTIGTAGTNVLTAIPAQQSTLTFRTLEGNNMRVTMLETTETTLDRVPYAGIGVFYQTIMDFVVSTDNWILARDTSYPIASLNFLGGQNERTFRQRHR